MHDFEKEWKTLLTLLRSSASMNLLANLCEEEGNLGSRLQSLESQIVSEMAKYQFCAFCVFV